MGAKSSHFLLPSPLEYQAADMSATLSKGNRLSSALTIHNILCFCLYCCCCCCGVWSGAVLFHFTFDVQKCRLSRAKLTEIYANAKVNKRSLHKLCERQRHIQSVWVTDWLSVWTMGRPTSWQATCQRGCLQLRSLPGPQGALFLLRAWLHLPFAFPMRMSTPTHTDITTPLKQ